LFAEGKSKFAVVCDADKWGQRLKKEIFLPTFSYGEKESDCFAENEVTNSAGTSFDCFVLGAKTKIYSRFVGDYNVQNLLGAILTARMLGVGSEKIKKAIPSIEPAEGRFNTINFGDKKIIVDFAHTPDGLEKVLTTAKSLPHNRLVCVFGCGGNRDKGKRPIMGEIAERLCDEVVLTSDNPRFERPLDIIDEISRGMSKGEEVIIPKREEAIFYALKNAKTQDLIVIAGKGGEKYQDIDGVKHPYDDFQVIKETIDKLSKAEERKYGN